MNKKGVLPLIPATALFFIILIGGLIALGAFFISNSFRWVLIGIAILIGFVWLLGQAVRSDSGFSRGKVVVLLVFLGIGLFFILGNSILQVQFGNTFVKPDWARLECAPTDSFEGTFIKWVDQQTLFPCDGFTEECRFVVQHTGSGAFVKNINLDYQECDLNGNNCNAERSLRIDDGEAQTLQTIKSGRSYKFETGGISNFGEQHAKVTQTWKPWKLFRFVDGAKFEVNNVNCDITTSVKASIREKDDVDSLFRFGGEGTKWVNYVNDWNFGPATNVFSHDRYGEVYCTAGQIFDIVELEIANGDLVKVDPTYSKRLPNGETLSGLGNRISNVECCPNEPSCNDDFELIKADEKEQQCVSDIQCFNAGGPVPVTQTSYVKYECVSSECVKSEPIAVECTTNAGCVDGQICDLSTTNYGKCIDQKAGDYCGDGTCGLDENAVLCPSDCSEQLECEWWQESFETTKEDCGFLGYKKALPFVECETSTERGCKTAGWVYLAMGIGILLLTIATILLMRPIKRRKK